MPNDTAGVPNPETDPALQALEQLVEARPACLYCLIPISHWDMFVGWPAADVLAHFDCYAKAQNLVKNTAIAEVRS